MMSSRIPQAESIVFVVDDDISVREALELLFRSVGLKAQLFASAQAFLSHSRTKAPCCLVLDVSLPDLNGLELQQRIASERLHMPIIFITGHGDIPMTVKAMKAGAAEFLAKPFDDEMLLQAVRHAIASSSAMLDEEAEIQALEGFFSSLTHREREVMELVVSGLLNKQIGGELGISEITVKAHRGRVMKKMHARSLADLVKKAAKLPMQSPPR
ncbi:response regulator transcription factor [Dyella choica]|uniref:Response regulator transcription factor n=2 Tax=Dyella choica TaxID=1927959 RepID=A0A3S0SCD3_9GAMM|nr:response regulator transcription factor [Dyella choica]